MNWPWRRRSDDAIRRAEEAEAKLKRAEETHRHAAALAKEARREAERSRQAHAENGFAQLIRTAMGVER